VAEDPPDFEDGAFAGDESEPVPPDAFDWAPAPPGVEEDFAGGSEPPADPAPPVGEGRSSLYSIPLESA